MPTYRVTLTRKTIQTCQVAVCEVDETKAVNCVLNRLIDRESLGSDWYDEASDEPEVVEIENRGSAAAAELYGYGIRAGAYDDDQVAIVAPPGKHFIINDLPFYRMQSGVPDSPEFVTEVREILRWGIATCNNPECEYCKRERQYLELYP